MSPPTSEPFCVRANAVPENPIRSERATTREGPWPPTESPQPHHVTCLFSMPGGSIHVLFMVWASRCICAIVNEGLERFLEVPGNSGWMDGRWIDYGCMMMDGWVDGWRV